jgi:ketosteroid isomerase-like protein
VTSNTELVRNWLDAFNGGDVDAMLAVADEDSEWVVAREHPAATTHRGREAMRAYLLDWQATMPDFHFEVDEMIEAGDLVLTLGRAGGTGQGSGAAAEIQFATITRFREGRAVRTEEFLDPAEARAEFERRSSP